MYIPSKPQFDYIKVGFKACFRDGKYLQSVVSCICPESGTRSKAYPTCVHLAESIVYLGTRSHSDNLQIVYILTFTTLWANSADNKLAIFFFVFSQKTVFDISCKLENFKSFFWAK